MELMHAVPPQVPSPYTQWIQDVMKETQAERLERKAKYCNRCFYGAAIAGSSPGQALCNYIEITGHMRGCSPIGCRKFKPGKAKRTRRPDGTMKETKKTKAERNDADRCFL